MSRLTIETTAELDAYLRDESERRGGVEPADLVVEALHRVRRAELADADIVHQRLRRMDDGEPGVDAREALRVIGDQLGLDVAASRKAES